LVLPHWFFQLGFSNLVFPTWFGVDDTTSPEPRVGIDDDGAVDHLSCGDHRQRLVVHRREDRLDGEQPVLGGDGKGECAGRDEAKRE